MLDDYRGGIRTTVNGHTNTDDQALWQLRNSEFVRDAKKATLLAKDWTGPTRESNADYLRAMDHALHSMSLSFADFKSKKVPHMLPYGATRYLVPANQLPAAVCSDLNLMYRICIQHLDGRRELEYSHDDDQRLSISCSDGGPIGINAYHFIYSTSGGTRGLHKIDPCHSRWNGFRKCVKENGLFDVWGDWKATLLLHWLSPAAHPHHIDTGP